MERDEKLSILKQLSRSDSEKAASALKREFERAALLLVECADYYELKTVLEELGIYGHRVTDDVISALSSLLERLQGAVFVTCDPNYAWSSPAEMQINLTNDALELVELFRYFDTTAVIKILIHFSENVDENVARTAIDGLKKCAAYDIQVFYSGEGRAGLGAAPQLEILSYLEMNKNEFVQKRTRAAQCLCAELLSPSMEGTSWDYKTVTWFSGAIPVCDATVEVRHRTISFLKKIYQAERSVPEKISLIRALMTSMEVPRRAEYGDDLKVVIVKDTLDVLDWLKTIIHNECFPVLQKIEHDVYWRYYHGISDEIRQSCLEIRDLLYENSEYEIYRNLIGFESVFEDWEQSLSSERDFASIEKERHQKSSGYVQEINEHNWAVWKERIIEFCRTESNDLATFPIFFDFLRELAEAQPSFAFELVCDHLEQVEYFTIPIYRGLWDSKLQDECRALLMQLSNEGKQLAAIPKVFLGEQKLDRNLLENVLQKASESENEFVLSSLLEVAGHNYTSYPDFAIDGLFVPVLKRLKELNCKNWVHNIWRLRNLREIITKLSEENMEVFLSALVLVERVDFHAEELLEPIAELHPVLVLDFFRQRIGFEDRSSDYEAVPFDLHDLRGPLSKHPRLNVSVIRSWYDENDGMFQFRGGKLVANIYPNFSDELETELITLIRTGEKSDARFVLDILKNYHGQPFLHPVCREIVMMHFSDKSMMSEVYIVLVSTGVVSGEFGRAEALSQKATEIEHWLNDEDENVREFARRQIETLNLEERQERERAQESIELRKYRYGVKDE